jgi:hypothetical protein
MPKPPLQQHLLEFFGAHYGRSRIGLVGTHDFVGMAVRHGQRKLTANGEPSLWSHVFIMGDIRPDRRGPGGTTGRSVYIFESDLHVDPGKTQLWNGAQENWVGKWCSELADHAAILDFSLTEEEKDAVLGTALQLRDEQIKYPLLELVGTWWAIIMQRLWAPNPFDEPHAMYCSAFVRYCYRAGGRDFLGEEVAMSNTAPEHIAQSAPFLAEWHR